MMHILKSSLFIGRYKITRTTYTNRVALNLVILIRRQCYYHSVLQDINFCNMFSVRDNIARANPQSLFILYKNYYEEKRNMVITCFCVIQCCVANCTKQIYSFIKWKRLNRQQIYFILAIYVQFPYIYKAHAFVPQDRQAEIKERHLALS